MDQEITGKACKYCRYWKRFADLTLNKGMCEVRIVLPQWFVEAVERLNNGLATTYEYYGRECESFKERIDERKD